MTDGVIKSTGNSRYLKSVANFMALYPTYEDFAAALIAGTLPVDLNGINPDGWSQQGTLMNTANLLADTTGAMLGLGSTGTVNAALAALKTSLNAFPAASKVAAIETGTASASASTFSITTTNTPVCILFMCNEANKLNPYTDAPAVGIAGQSYGVLMDYGYNNYDTHMKELTVSVSGKTWKISTKGGASLSKKFTYFALTKK